jgi:hypothetical protein
VSFTQTNVGWTGLQSFAVGPLGPINTNTGESGSLGATSVTGGLQIGYNWPFVVAEPDLLLEVLVVALDAPAQFGDVDHLRIR